MYENDSKNYQINQSTVASPVLPTGVCVTMEQLVGMVATHHATIKLLEAEETTSNLETNKEHQMVLDQTLSSYVKHATLFGLTRKLV